VAQLKDWRRAGAGRRLRSRSILRAGRLSRALRRSGHVAGGDKHRGKATAFLVSARVPLEQLNAKMTALTARRRGNAARSIALDRGSEGARRERGAQVVVGDLREAFAAMRACSAPSGRDGLREAGAASAAPAAAAGRRPPASRRIGSRASRNHPPPDAGFPPRSGLRPAARGYPAPARVVTERPRPLDLFGAGNEPRARRRRFRASG